VRYNVDGLVPCAVQHDAGGEVLIDLEPGGA